MAVFNVNEIFGGKKWFKSWTAWGLIIWQGGSAMANQACGEGLIGASVCATVVSITTIVGQVLTALGIRRAATAKNTD